MNIFKILKSTVAGNRPTGAQLVYGQPYVNFADQTFGVVNSSNVPQDIAGPGFNQGFVNRLRNGTFDVWQRGTGSISCPAAAITYTADGWIVTPIGAAVTTQLAAGRGPTVNALQINGAASVTQVNLTHRVESSVGASLGGISITLQAQVFHNTGGTITPQISIGHATARDNYTTTANDVPATNMQSCSNGVWTRVAYTFTVPVASAALGLNVNIIFTSLISGVVQVTEADLRATPGLPLGLCANPPPPELRPIHEETLFCQRYFHRPAAMTPGLTQYATGASQALIGAMLPYPVKMRATPTVTYTPATQTNCTVAMGTTGVDYHYIVLNATAVGLCVGSITGGYSFSAEL